jgi:hypothetical protein
LIFSGGYGKANRDEQASEEAQEEFAKLLVVIAAVLLFIVSAALSVNEARYAIWGQTVRTQDFKRTDVMRSRNMRKVAVVRYTFLDGTKTRTEEDEVDIDFPFPAANAVDVQYIPGTDSSRLLGHRRVWPLWILGGSILVIAWQACRFWRFYKS